MLYTYTAGATPFSVTYGADAECNEIVTSVLLDFDP